MISNVKYKNEWYHDSRRHQNIRKGLRTMPTSEVKHLKLLELSISNPFQLFRRTEFESSKTAKENAGSLGKMDKTKSYDNNEGTNHGRVHCG